MVNTVIPNFQVLPMLTNDLRQMVSHLFMITDHYVLIVYYSECFYPSV